MNRRDALQSLLIALSPLSMWTGAAAVRTVIGTGMPGYADQQVNDPYGLAWGPDGALYFCDLDNQRIRRLDLETRRTSDVAGNGQRGYAGDGGPATAASLNMPHEIQFDARGHLYIAERDNHVVRKVDARTGVISTLAGTGSRRVLGRRRPGGSRGAASAAQHRRAIRTDASAHLRHRQPAHPACRPRDRHHRDLRGHR